MFWAVLALAAAPAFHALAEEPTCYTGSHESGELSFSGAMEGAPFQGGFGEFSVRYCSDGQIEVTVATASAAIGNRDADQALAGEEFFHPEAFPQATWSGGSLADTAQSQQVNGTLTLRGISRPVPVKISLSTNGNGVRMHGGTELNRLDFRVGTGEFQDTSFIANEVKVRFELELAPET